MANEPRGIDGAIKSRLMFFLCLVGGKKLCACFFLFRFFVERKGGGVCFDVFPKKALGDRSWCVDMNYRCWGARIGYRCSGVL